jgi:hypothetical protein
MSIMLPLSMTSRTVDPPEPSLTPTDAGTQETTPAPPSQSSREPSLFSRLSSRFNKTQKITVEPKKITIEPIKASYVATKDKEKPAIGTAVGKKFLKTFDHLIDQNPEWFSGIFLKLFSHSDQQQAVISSHTEGQDCHLYWQRNEISFEGWFSQSLGDEDTVFKVRRDDHDELTRWPLRQQLIACLLVAQDGTSFVVVFKPINKPDTSKGEEQYNLPFSIYNYQDMIFASQ